MSPPCVAPSYRRDRPTQALFDGQPRSAISLSYIHLFGSECATRIGRIRFVVKRIQKDMTVEEFDDWSNARKKFKEVAEFADEIGGPRLSLVPFPEQNTAWPTDLLPPIPPRNGDVEAQPVRGTDEHRTDHPKDGGGAENACTDVNLASVPATPFDGIPLESSRNRAAGWSAERQKLFLTVLAETGQIHLAAAAARLSVRSAQALRVRSPAFQKGWRVAEQLAVGRLSPIAFDRSINGRIEQIYRDGELVAERRVPSDKLLTWLLARLDPKRFALPWEQRGDADPQAEAAAAFPALLEAITDVVS